MAPTHPSSPSRLRQPAAPHGVARAQPYRICRQHNGAAITALGHLSTFSSGLSPRTYHLELPKDKIRFSAHSHQLHFTCSQIVPPYTPCFQVLLHVPPQRANSVLLARAINENRPVLAHKGLLSIFATLVHASSLEAAAAPIGGNAHPATDSIPSTADASPGADGLNAAAEAGQPREQLVRVLGSPRDFDGRGAGASGEHYCLRVHALGRRVGPDDVESAAHASWLVEQLCVSLGASLVEEELLNALPTEGTHRVRCCLMLLRTALAVA